jgi:hypothetical protein
LFQIRMSDRERIAADIKALLPDTTAFPVETADQARWIGTNFVAGQFRCGRWIREGYVMPILMDHDRRLYAGDFGCLSICPIDAKA